MRQGEDDGVHKPSQGQGAVLPDIAEVRAAQLAMEPRVLGMVEPRVLVMLEPDGVGGHGEGGEAVVGVKLVLGAEQRGVAARAGVDSLAPVADVLAGERALHRLG